MIEKKIAIAIFFSLTKIKTIAVLFLGEILTITYNMCLLSLHRLGHCVRGVIMFVMGSVQFAPTTQRIRAAQEHSTVFLHLGRLVFVLFKAYFHAGKLDQSLAS